MEYLFSSDLTGALKRLRDIIPRLAHALNLGKQADIKEWTQVMDGKLFPILSPDFPLIAAICGGGSSGKSTLFNTLIGKKISPTGGKAGLNRRVLVAAHEKHLNNTDFLTFLFEPFQTPPEPLKNKSDLIEPGPPVYVVAENIPSNLVLMDTPDFDTGARGEYINRELARQALETADILIYIFTNSNYNNRDNTDFIANMLTHIGKRRCFLIYRVYSSFSTDEVVEHAMTVAGNLYGKDAEQYLLGIYRADENNEVAAGRANMAVSPVFAGKPAFMEALSRIDPRKQRRDLLDSILKDVIGGAEKFRCHLEISADALQLYLDALNAAQSLCVQEALAHFPMDRVIKRFAEIWLETDPGYIRAMRKTGSVVGLPFKMVMSAGKWTRRQFSGEHHQKPSVTYKDKVEEDLLTAVNSLYQTLLAKRVEVSLAASDPVACRMRDAVERIRNAQDSQIAFDDLPAMHFSTEAGTIHFSVPSHPALAPEQDRLRRRDWRTTVKTILEKRETIISFTRVIDQDLSELVDKFRRKMGILEKSRQTFSALLNVVPATAAVTYILATGDPMGATGIKVKLSGLFGLHDLYALVAIPATTGLNKADRNQLEELLGPIARAWLNSKMKTVQEIFQEEITHEMIDRATYVITQATEELKEIHKNIEISGKAVSQ